MVTNIRIEMSEGALKELGRRITGKAKPATRKQISKWVGELVERELENIAEGNAVDEQGGP